MSTIHIHKAEICPLPIKTLIWGALEFEVEIEVETAHQSPKYYGWVYLIITHPYLCPRTQHIVWHSALATDLDYDAALDLYTQQVKGMLGTHHPRLLKLIKATLNQHWGAH